MAAIKEKTRGQLIIISGTTCAGKGTIINKLIEKNPNLELSISYTSRPMREGDKEGVDYYFISQEEFEKKIDSGDFLEYAKSQYDCYYGTPKKELEEKLASGRDVILEINVEGAQNVKKMFPETILIFILAPSMEEVKRRIKARGGENTEQIIKRFENAYHEINEINKYNYVVVNDVVEDAVKKVEAILISERCRVDRIEEVFVESKEEVLHEFLMGKEFDNTVTPIDK